MNHVDNPGALDCLVTPGRVLGGMAPETRQTQEQQADIANLRRARIRCHKKLRQTEALLAAYKAKLESIETAIYAIDPNIKLPSQHRQYSTLFKRGEYTRITLDVMREAGEPLPLRKVALLALAAKGVAMPDALLRKRTRHRIGTALVVFQARGVVEKVRYGKWWRWGLV